MTDDADTPPQPTDVPHEPTYPISVGARALRKSRRWYEEQLKAGRLPGHKAGRTWFLTASDIAAAIESTSRPAKSTSRPNTIAPDAVSRPRPSRRRATRRRRVIPPQSEQR